MGSPFRHTAVNYISMLIKVAVKASANLWKQVFRQPSIPEALVRLIKTEFNERFRQVFTNALPVRWPHLTIMTRKITTGHFVPESMVVQVVLL